MYFFMGLAIVFLVLWLVERTKKEKKAATIADADQYSTEKREEANTYFETKRSEANTYFETKHREALDYYAKKTKNADARAHRVEEEIAQLSADKAELQSELDSLRMDVICETVSIDAYDNLKSDEVKNELSLLKVKQDSLVKAGNAVTVTNYNAAPMRAIDSQRKQILRCFNSECAGIIENVTTKNIDSSRAKMQRTFDTLNKVFDIDNVRISTDYFALKLEELSLVYAYMVKIEEEKEQKRAIREQMLEEDKVRREIEKAKQKIEKEENQFNNEIKKLMGHMQKTANDVEKQLYIDKIRELEEKLKALEVDKENVLRQEQNTRAGFVYIISNIGSFGESVYKIGMTRRLDPMERISELSSASVPFPFDVHAMIFSEDAPALETLLHHHFQSSQVNKVNSRKEFFRVDLDEIKKLVIENHNATVKFVDIPEALEYRETLRMEQLTAQGNNA